MRQQISRCKRCKYLRSELLPRYPFPFFAQGAKQRRRNAFNLLRTFHVLRFQFIRSPRQKEYVQQTRGGKIALRKLRRIAFQRAGRKFARFLRISQRGGGVSADHAAPEDSCMVRTGFPVKSGAARKNRLIVCKQIALLHQIPRKARIAGVERQCPFTEWKSKRRFPLLGIGFANRRQDFRILRLCAKGALQMPARAAE